MPRLADGDAARLLAALADPSPELGGAAFLYLRTAIAARIIGVSEQTRAVLKRRCGQMKLFRAWDGSRRGDAVLSWDELEQSRDDGLLFVQQRSEGRGLAENLQAALAEASIFVVGADVARSVLGDPHVPGCDRGACATLLLRGPTLAPFAERKPLITALFEELRRDPRDDHRVRAIRYLLHGEPAQRTNMAPLLTGDIGGDLWSRLAQQALGGDRWRVIPTELANAIPQDMWAAPDLQRMNAASVCDLLKERGPECIDCEPFSDADRLTMMREIDDDDVLRRLRMHRDTEGQLRAITDDVYLKSSVPVDPEISGLVRLLVVPDEFQRLAPGRRWRDGFAIDVALSQPEPGRFWRAILNALDRVSAQSSLGDERQQRLRSTAWLPLDSGGLARPEDVLFVAGVEDHLARLASLAGGAFFDVGKLAPDVLAHAGFASAKRSILPDTDKVLEAVGLIIASCPALRDFAIGPLSLEHFQLQAFLDAFASAPPNVMRCRDFLEAIRSSVSAEQCTDILVPQLLTDIPPERLLRILDFLVEQHEQAAGQRRAAMADVHRQYLGQLALLPNGRVLLREIRLKNRSGRWRRTAELCSGYDNLDEDFVLDDEQAETVARLLVHRNDSSADGAPAVEAGVPSPHSGPIGELEPEQAAEMLGNYFLPWQGCHVDEAIGGFLSILGDDSHLRALAGRYLGQRDIDVIRDQIEWRALPSGMGGGGEDVHRMMERQRFLVSITQPGCPFEVHNLLGDCIPVPICEKFDDLLVGDLFRSRIEGRTNRLTLRQIHPQEFESRELSGFLRATALEILNQVYRQRAQTFRLYDRGGLSLDEFGRASLEQGRTFERWWNQLEDSSGVELKVSQALLLEHLLSSSKQFRLYADRDLDALFREWDEAHRIAVESESIPDERVRQSRKNDAERRSHEVRDRLKALLTTNQQVEWQFLEAVQAIIHDHYQYQTGSVPFELFQNADDAVMELEELQGADADSSDRSRARFVVSWNEQSVSFAHWGRPINEFRSFGESNVDGRARGFHQDLEKMLMVGASDKGIGSGQPEVTGKFGMGFKSVFLLSDHPRVLSGRLAFEIAGGVYPQRITGEQYTLLEQQLKEVAGVQPDGTLIELPLRSQERPRVETDLRRFGDLAPILLVFSRRVKQITLRRGREPERVVAWRPSSLPGTERVTSGRLTSTDLTRTLPGSGLALGAGTASLLLGLGARGIERFPGEVPGLWVTAPTEELKGLGFAVNGAFDLDIGRAQVARVSQKNAETADRLGTDLGSALVELFQASARSWEDFRSSLDLAHDVSGYQFWESLVETLSKPFARGAGKDDRTPALTLVERMLWQDDRHGVRRLLAACRALPNGLWGEYQQLVKLSEVQHRVAGLLAERSCFEAVSAFESFQKRVKRHEVATDAALAGLPIEISSEISKDVPLLELSDALDWELQPGYVVPPSMATVLGRILTPLALEKLAHGTSAANGEQVRLRELLNRLQFRERDGSVRRARELLIGSTFSSEDGAKDEVRRAAFAPDGYVLSPDYAGDGIDFFKLCRGNMDAPAERLAEWGRSTVGDERQTAFLRYLLDGDLSTQVAAHLRGNLGTAWLPSLAQSPLLDRVANSPSDRLRLLAPLDLIPPDWIRQPVFAPSPPPASTMSAGDALRSIADWWKRDGLKRLAAYEDDVYPEGLLRLEPHRAADTGDPAVRAGWMELFILGATHTLGRVRDDQHRNFVRLCHDRGWLDVFAARPEQFNAENWMEVIRSYLDVQVEEARFYYWLRLFVPIFQLSYWLDEYTELYLGADPSLSGPRADFAAWLAPRAASAFQGGGIDPPPLGRTLGIGAHFVLRELARKGLVKTEGALRHCFVPGRRLRDFMARLGCQDMGNGVPRSEQSGYIYDFLVDHLGPEDATFGNAFDIPLLIVARDWELQSRLFGGGIAGPQNDPEIDDDEL